MADTKISALGEAATAAAVDETVIVQGGTTKKIGIDTLFSTANAAWRGWTYLTAPLTSGAWDGDAYSTTAKTVIDLSAVFAVPAGVKAILAETTIRDSGSAASECFLILSPNNTAASGPMTLRIYGETNDYYRTMVAVVPCDASGDVYYQVLASGASTLDAILRIWGYAQ